MLGLLILYSLRIEAIGFPTFGLLPYLEGGVHGTLNPTFPKLHLLKPSDTNRNHADPSQIP